MSQVDWAQGPAEATHHVHGSIYPWERRVGDLWLYWVPEHSNWVLLSAYSGDERVSSSCLEITARPDPQP